MKIVKSKKPKLSFRSKILLKMMFGKDDDELMDVLLSCDIERVRDCARKTFDRIGAELPPDYILWSGVVIKLTDAYASGKISEQTYEETVYKIEPLEREAHVRG